MSLGTWFRDYVYIPLGGNRVSKWRGIFNIFVVWMLTGFWHGAYWNFVLWGLFFFVFLVIEKIGLLKILEKIPAFFSHLYLLIVVFFGWILFRFSDFRYIPVVIKGLFGLNGNTFMDFETKTLLIGNIILPLGILFLSTLALVGDSYNPFLYFQF